MRGNATTRPSTPAGMRWQDGVGFVTTTSSEPGRHLARRSLGLLILLLVAVMRPDLISSVRSGRAT